jgi:His-Xaa-Ser system radical SAM maturase HxsB
MAISYHDFPEMKEYALNRFFSKKLDNDNILITTDHGGWVIVSQEEYDLLRFKRVDEDPNLFNLLEEKGIILTKDNMNRISKLLEDKFSHLSMGVSLHEVVPTLRCDHACVYCHAKSKPLNAKGYDMDEETAKSVVDFIFQSPSNGIAIEFQGGEPLANFPIVQFITEYAEEKNKKEERNLIFKIVTNLSLMDEDILRFLMKHKISICTSLDGPKELHDRNRKFTKGSSYEKVTHWIKDIRIQYGSKIHALPTITKYSLEYVKEIVDEYVKLGFDRIRIRSLNYAGFAGERWKEIGYTPQEYLNFWKESLEYCFQLNRKGTYFIEGMATLVARKILSKDWQAYTCWGPLCGAGLAHTAYDQWGDIYACDESRSFEVFKLGNTKENNYKDIYTSASNLALIALSSGLSSICDACVFHPFCGTCLVSTYGSQNNLISKIPLDNECKIRGEMVEHIFKKLVFSKDDRKILLKWSSTKKGL